jgi:hypothetical protein
MIISERAANFYNKFGHASDECERLDCGWKIVLHVKLKFGFTYFPLTGEGIMDRPRLADAALNEDEQRIYERLEPLFEQERRRMARALASGPLFGQKEFELRDQVHEMGARALEVAADERQKKGRISRS